jgi:hypothetical protein
LSLVNDALKKARHEQAVKEARAHGLPDPLPLSYNPYRPKSRTPPLVAALAVGLLVLAAAGATWFLAARTTPAPGPSPVATPVTPPSAQPVPQAPPPAPEPASLPSTEKPPGQARGGARAPEAPPAARALAPSPSVEREARQGTNVPAPQPAPQPAPPPAAPAAAVADGAVFRRKMPLPDGTTLELGGIAFSDVAPFAYLNGRLVGVGEGVAGWRIVAIERTGVRLSDGTTTVRIDLK